MAQWLGALTALAEGLDQFPASPWQLIIIQFCRIWHRLAYVGTTCTRNTEKTLINIRNMFFFLKDYHREPEFGSSTLQFTLSITQVPVALTPSSDLHEHQT